VRFLRHGLPILICVIGLAWGVARNMDDQGLEILILLVAAGSSLWLITWLFRLGVATNTDRDVEEEARKFFDEHGYWEEDGPPPARG
jgi:hypothetical protein